MGWHWYVITLWDRFIMKITSLKVNNFRNLIDYEINFNEYLTVLVADNGAGKTAILSAITVVHAL